MMEQHSEWNGKPKWNGKIVDVKLSGCVLAFNPLMGPVLTLIEGCEDYFLPIFSNVDDLHKHIQYLQNRGLGKFNYVVKKIDDANEFLDSIREVGVRVMLNPEVITDHHTKWKEVIKSGEEWKFVDAERN